MCGLAADNNNKVYMELMIFLWNNHYNLNFNVGLSDNSKMSIQRPPLFQKGSVLGMMIT